ncbi:putative amino-acid-binding protein YxeM precursor [Pseudoalteromonas sp. P1-9]|uniref:substrate-binding periplasmic protein n=1 Tax=Pseudoalteromonas TaxID=53246 RepID=UPI0006D5DED2|nr:MULTISPECIES: transporter substrate-binding domain-containing protein [Pseudoalteromonas]KPV96360.1 putative amino-acid-binding protein YxeM precursor [Pseudoalteromonas sp. P1-9]TMO88637.1 ABC transporter substrate-binding protein [Pseudoalteromonas spongiae]
MLKYVCLALVLFACDLFSCDITVRVEQYSAQSQKVTGRWQGLDVELAELLLNEAHCEFDFVDLPWARSLKLLENGEIDLMMSVTKTDEREQFAYFVGPQRFETLVFVSPPMSEEITQVTQLFSLNNPVAIQTGSFYGEAFMNTLAQSERNKDKIVWVTNNQTKAILLKSQRISGYLEAKLNIMFEQQQGTAMPNLKIHPLIVNKAAVYFAFSKQSVSPALVSKLKHAFLVLQKSGKIDAILAKYGAK